MATLVSSEDFAISEDRKTPAEASGHPRGQAPPEPTQPSILDGLPDSPDHLTRAQRVQARAATVGFDWSDAWGAFEKVLEEVEEVREALEAGTRSLLEEELGDLLLAVVNLTRLAGMDAATALERANDKFVGRFRALERLAAERGLILGEASLEELDALWDEVKRARAMDRSRGRDGYG